MTGRGLIGWAIGAMAWLLMAVSSALAAPAGLITETPVGLRTHSYLFGLTTGPDGAIWFADLSCTGLGRCAIGRVGHQGRVAEYRRGLAPGSVPYAIAAGADGNLWFTDEGATTALGTVTAGALVVAHVSTVAPRGATGGCLARTQRARCGSAP